MTSPERYLQRKCALMILVMLNSLAIAQRLDCEGTVLRADGRPVKNATVGIYTAKVRAGTSPYCPSCYADCRKRTRTDARGRFVLHALDPELRFRVLVVAEGYGPKFVDNVEPEEGAIAVVLSPIAAERLAPSHVMRGRVVGPDGSPVAEATIEPIAKGSAEMAMLIGPCSPDEVDPLAVTNGQGEFLLTAEVPNLTVWVTVRARGLASCCYRSLGAGSPIHEIKLSSGCTVKGRLIGKDLPVKETTIGVAQSNRALGRFVGEYTTGLHKDGRFEIHNLPPNEDYYLYTTMESLQGRGTVSVRQFRTGADDSDVDIGELTLEHGHEVTVHVILRDGKAIPYKTRFLISRDDAWDTLICELDKDGRFRARGLPSGAYCIAVLVSGYRVASANSGFAARDGFILRGTITSDIKDLTVFMEPGERGLLRSQKEPKKEAPTSSEVHPDATTRFLRGMD